MMIDCQLRRDGCKLMKKTEKRGGNAYICPILDDRLSGNTFFVSENICFGSEEDFSFVEREHGQRKQHSPHHAHDDSHKHVEGEQAGDLERVTEDAQTRNPAHIREYQSPACDGRANGSQIRI
jgi:hypothetical protein